MSRRSADTLIDQQRSYIRILEKKTETYRQQVEDMKALVAAVTREWDVAVPDFIRLQPHDTRRESWSDKSPTFDRARSHLLEAAIALAKATNEPLPQAAIIAEALNRHPDLNQYGESTLTARLREMCHPMNLLTRVKPGYYFPSRNAVEQP